MRSALTTAFLILLYAFAASVVAIPAGDAAVSDAAPAGSIKELLAMKNVTSLAVGSPCGPVTGANVGGVCLNRDTTCCNGFYTRGFCRNDPANVLCCTAIQRCSDNSGFCNDVDHVSCSVPYVHGLCPGPFAVQCCRGANGGAFCTPGGPG